MIICEVFKEFLKLKKDECFLYRKAYRGYMGYEAITRCKCE